ncbi:MAG: Rpn family recombination-promoting nuclease/putative transposase [Cytophagales bacterium]|nr:Rpn family recombination-promoting nuclease/putative transposase [Bernardetiaceae bacterium]MDW8204200.1 Rpn family recombination-promoting nuclease/putative transposase [Cytophagales bacterium]
MARYLNPFTDFGFKKLFGNEQNKDLLISFLNQILPDNQISTINYLRTEHLGQTDLDRKVIYDLYCENERGEKFIVALQKAKQSFFKDRTLFYATFPIQQQAQQGDWNYELKAVYTVAVLDFCFDDEDRDKVKVQVKLMDTDKKTVFYNKLTFLYLQMPNFRKNEEELETLEDKWFYLLRHLAEFQNRPQRLQEKIFDRLFEAAEIAKFDPQERQAYEDSLRYYRDVKNSLDTAREEGREQERIAIARRMLAKGFSPTQISEVTGLTQAEIELLSKH